MSLRSLNYAIKQLSSYLLLVSNTVYPSFSSLFFTFPLSKYSTFILQIFCLKLIPEPGNPRTLSLLIPFTELPRELALFNPPEVTNEQDPDSPLASNFRKNLRTIRRNFLQGAVLRTGNFSALPRVPSRVWIGISATFVPQEVTTETLRRDITFFWGTRWNVRHLGAQWETDVHARLDTPGMEHTAEIVLIKSHLPLIANVPALSVLVVRRYGCGHQAFIAVAAAADDVVNRISISTCSTYVTTCLWIRSCCNFDTVGQ